MLDKDEGWVNGWLTALLRHARVLGLSCRLDGLCDGEDEQDCLDWLYHERQQSVYDLDISVTDLWHECEQLCSRIQSAGDRRTLG